MHIHTGILHPNKNLSSCHKLQFDTSLSFVNIRSPAGQFLCTTKPCLDRKYTKKFGWGCIFFQEVRPSVHRDRQIDTQTSFYFYIKIIAVLESYQKYCTYTKQGC